MIMYCQKCKQPVVMDDAIFQENPQAQPFCPTCQSPLVHRKVLAPGDQIAGFSIIRELGHGGMGIVYLAEQTNLNRKVALKILEDSLAGDQDFVQSFFREASAAAKLAHPNIVQAFDAGIDNGVCYFVMELIQGQNLDDYVAQNGPMQTGLLLNVAVYIADALAYAWEKNHLSHGDIKPENIILQNNGEIKLADLGLARDHQYDVLVPGEIMATPAYAPPEVIRGEINRINFKADMYSFGTTLYHLATGAPPFPDEDPKIVCEKQLNNQPKPLIAILPDIPEELSALVDQLMEKSPDHRPYSWQFVTQQLMKIRRDWNQKRSSLTSTKLNLPTDPPDETENPSLNFNYKWVISALAFVLCVLITALIFLYSKGYFSQNTNGNPDLNNSMTVRQKWAMLKRDIQNTSNSNALRKIDQFIAAYDNAPHEAAALKSTYQKLIRFDSHKHSFLNVKSKLFIDANKQIGCRPADPTVTAKQQLFAISVFKRQMDSLRNYARQLELPYDFQPLTNRENNQLLQYQTALERKVSFAYNGNNKYQSKFQFAEIQLFLRKLSCAASCAEVKTLINEFHFLSDNLQWNNSYKNIQKGLALILIQDHFTTDSQFLINMKKYLKNRKISPNMTIRDIRENGILCINQTTKQNRLISWTQLYDFWHNPVEELLLPTFPSMSENDAISFFSRSLLMKKNIIYYRDLLKKSKNISGKKRNQLLLIANAILSY